MKAWLVKAGHQRKWLKSQTEKHKVKAVRKAAANILQESEADILNHM